MTDYISPKDFSQFLDETKGEREVSKYLEQHSQILYWTLCRASGHCRFVFREFPLGSDYKVDYVIVNSYSGVWEMMFIELEPVDDPVFTKAGVPTKRLAGAIKQLGDWKEYVDMHKDSVRATLVKWAEHGKDILGYSGVEHISNYSGDYLADPASYLADSYHIVIGRRDNVSRSGHKRKASYTLQHRMEIMSYDRILDLVRDRYKDV